MRRMALTVMAMILLSGAVRAAVQASLDSNEVAAGDSVQLTLQHEGQTSEQPDLSPLQQDFDVLSTSRSNSVQIVNGSMSSQVRIQVMLSPKHAGRLVVPPITWGGERTGALTVVVAGGANPSSGAGAGAGAGTGGGAASDHVFVETTVEPKDPYVQAAVSLTLRIYADVQLLQGSLEFQGSSDVLVQQLGSDQNLTLVKNGEAYDVVERHYLLFPQRSGELTLPGAVLAGQIPVRVRSNRYGNDPLADLFGQAAGMVAGVKPIRVHGDPIVLHVRPQPAGAGNGAWLPARDLGLSAQWHPESLQVHAGDPITLDLHLRAEGLSAAQLPDLSTSLSLPAGLKAYPDQPKLDNAVYQDTVAGTRDQSVALIADRPGKFELPAVHVSWWDVKANQTREATLPARTLTVLPAAGGAVPPATPGSTTVAAPASATAAAQSPQAAPIGEQPRTPSNLPWILLAGGFAALWVVTGLAWWISRRRTPVPAATPRTAAGETGAQVIEPAQARREFHAACDRNEPLAARRLLLAWVAGAWPESPPQGLTEFAKRLGDERVTQELIKLDRACYGRAAWDGAPLRAALDDLPAPTDKPRGGDKDLAPLYR